MAVDVSQSNFVSRAGRKLQCALEAFGIDVTGAVCADFGCNVGGFTDCLLGRGAARVYAIDTGYGELAWRLRKDSRVVVMERTNALYCAAPVSVDLVAIDVAWTTQGMIVPAAMRWLADGARRGIVSLLKPHYEFARLRRKKPYAALSDDEAESVCLEVCSQLNELDCRVNAVVRSPLLGKGGNMEFLLHLVPRRAG